MTTKITPEEKTMLEYAARQSPDGVSKMFLFDTKRDKDEMFKFSIECQRIIPTKELVNEIEKNR